jgi:CHAD domain-containing protein
MSSGLADVHGVDGTSSSDDRGVPDPASMVDPSPGVIAEAAGEPTIDEPPIDEPPIDEPPIDEPPIDEPTLHADFAAAAAPIVADAVQIEPTTADPFVIPTKTPGVLPEDTIAEAGRKVLRFHLARMIAREPATRLGEDEEELHAMRVATRRMRAAWRVFGDGFRPERTKRFRGHLRFVAGRLGAVRDRDVLIDALRSYQATLPIPDRPAIQPLIDGWQDQREDARVLLIRELDSEGYRRWVDDYREFTRTEGMAVAPTTPTRPHRVRDTAPSRIWLAYEQVRAYEPVLRWADVTTLHELRIAGKRLRYTLEFVRETLGPEVTPLIARVVALQDHLGLLNDADVAGTLARSFLVEHSGELEEAETQVIGRYLVTREQEVARLRRTVGGPWRGVAGLAFRRALGRVTAGL